MPPYSRSRLRYRRKKTFYSRSQRNRKRTTSSNSTCLSEKVVSETRNWVDNLPHDVLVAIFQKVETLDILLNVQKVCVSWNKICRDPAIWHSIDIHDLDRLYKLDLKVIDYVFPYDIRKMMEFAVDRSCGQLVNISLEYFGTDRLLKYITDRKIQLKCLRIISCTITDEGLSEAAKMMPSMEELHITFGETTHVSLKNVGLNCPGLKSLTYKKPSLKSRFRYEESDDETSLNEDDVGIDPNAVALVISRTMPRLEHLNLIGNEMTNEGLKAILDSCLHLESLDLRRCFKVDLVSDPKLGKRCSSIKVFYHPNDYIDLSDDFAFYGVSDDYDAGSLDISENDVGTLDISDVDTLDISENDVGTFDISDVDNLIISISENDVGTLDISENDVDTLDISDIDEDW